MAETIVSITPSQSVVDGAGKEQELVLTINGYDKSYLSHEILQNKPPVTLGRPIDEANFVAQFAQQHPCKSYVLNILKLFIK